MATQVQFRRGTTAQNNSFTGALGEVTVDTDKDTVVVHDGGTAGGFPLARQDGSNMTGISITSGTIKLDGNYPVGTGNVALGDTVLNASLTGGYNTAMGATAMTALTSGSLNVGVGRIALGSLTSGSYNTGIGANALNANTQSNYNTAIGMNALLSHSSHTVNADSYMVAVGYNTLDANTTGVRSTGLGAFALGANTTGNDNVAVGYQSLNNNTTASENTAVGYQALYSNNAVRNTAIGYKSLRLTVNDDNTAVGAYSLESNTSGYYNVGIGYLAGNSNTTGASNVAIGTLALRYNITGGSNVAVGTSALALTTNNSNTAVGTSSLANTANAGNNTAVGQASGLSNTTGEDGVFIGRQAGYSNTTGGNNVAVGRDALYSNTTASNNTALGYRAGYYSTGELNTFVGNDSGFSMTTGTKNTILGRYNGNSGGLDIRTDTNRIVLSDGDGIPAVTWDGLNNTWEFNRYVAVSDGNFHSRFGGGQASNNNACGFVFLSCGADDDRTGLYWEQAGVINTRMWIDDTGDLRVFSGNPTTDTSGTVVGTQTFTGTHIYKTNETDLQVGEAVCLVGQKIVRATEAMSKTCVGIYAGQSSKIQDSMGNPCNENDGWGHAVIALGDTRFHQSDFETVGVLVDGAVTAGDLLCTSSTAGKLTVQDDDIIHSYTVGKAMESGDGSSPIYAYIYSG